MTWLYIIAVAAVVVFILWKMLPRIQRLTAFRSYRKDPEGYCEWLYGEVYQDSPKDQVWALRMLLEFGMRGAQPAKRQVWRIYDNPDTPLQFGNAITNFLRSHDLAEWDRRAAIIKEIEKNRPKEFLAKGLKLLKESDFIGGDQEWDNAKWDVWVENEDEIRAIAGDNLFPPERQLRFLFLRVHSSFKLSKHGMFGPDATFGGGTHEEISRKKDKEMQNLRELESRINNDYQRSLAFSSTVDEDAIAYYRERVSKYPFTVFLD